VPARLRRPAAVREALTTKKAIGADAQRRVDGDGRLPEQQDGLPRGALLNFFWKQRNELSSISFSDRGDVARKKGGLLRSQGVVSSGSLLCGWLRFLLRLVVVACRRESVALGRARAGN
jgi:hypothetical protein